MRSLSTLTSLLVLGTIFACAPARKAPRSLADADAAARAPASLDAASLSPQAKADADRRRKEAWDLFESGKTDEAEIVGEQALAAYELAALQSRSARAVSRAERVERQRSSKEEQLALLDGAQATLQGEVEALELKARVMLDSEPVADLKTVDSERLLARRKAAAKLASEAESLCLGARILGAQGERLAPLEEQLKKLQAELDVKGLSRDMFPRATELRASCLKELTSLRRENSKSAPQVSVSDQLLRELTENSFTAHRDDRGVIVEFRDPAEGASLREKTRTELSRLGALLEGHPELRAIVVAHTGASGDAKNTAAWLETASTTLQSGNRAKPETRNALGAEPRVDPRARGAIAENRRLEVVLVTARF